jgi:hypothetical protein
MRLWIPAFVLLVVACFGGGCRQTKEAMKTNNPEQSQEQTRLDFTAGPPTIVYKTKHDYADKVAVTLNEDKTSITAYPHPVDIAKRGSQVKPTQLASGYLLDNQGINERVAFTSYTFEEYAALKEVPTLAELQAHIIDKDPLLEMCHCGNRNQYSAIETDMNKIITQKLAPCKTLSLRNKTN